jgi:adenine-specific DNA-methyltransferase
MPAKKKPTTYKAVSILNHDEAKRKNIPTAEHQFVLEQDQKTPKTIRYPRKHRPRSPARLARQG